MINYTNPFEHIQSFMNGENFTKTMRFIPQVDFSAFAEVMKNTTDAMTEAGQIATKNMQCTMEKGAQAIQQNAAAMCHAVKESLTSCDVAGACENRQKCAEATFNNNCNIAKEVIDISAKSMIEILSIMQDNLRNNTSKIFTKNEEAH